MKQAIFLITVILFFSGLNTINAQDDSHKDRWEKYRAEKVSFITDKLQLSPSEAQKFWPVYNEMENIRWEAQKIRRELEEKVQAAAGSLSEKEIIKLTRDFAGNMLKEGTLIAKYNEDFLTILPPSKVLKLYQAENEFKMHMIRKFRDREKTGMKN